MTRSSGLLLPIFSLPSKYGCGSLGIEAYNFIDFLVSAKQKYWQMLPINHAGYGDSPYSAYSSFAGNPNFVDLDILKSEGLLDGLELGSLDFGDDESQINYEKEYAAKRFALKYAYEHRKEDLNFEHFKKDNESWLDSYAEYMAIKENEDAEYFKFVQYHFYKQWDSLKAYAKEKGVLLIGDIPIYVPLDSADVFAEPQYFVLDEQSGVPPDYFNEEGQLWGNPLYNWSKMKEDGYGWWIRRIGAALNFFDIVRLDHFRGFESYWAVPLDAQSAKSGHWEKGPGFDFVNTITSWFGKERFIAEDLGSLDNNVKQLVLDSGLPGMKVLEFAFNPDGQSDYLPYKYQENCVCYVGTHDNANVMQWAKEVPEDELNFAKEYCNCSIDDINIGLIKLGLASKANLFIGKLEDYLGLGKEARMNVPGTEKGNWRWRINKSQLSIDLAKEIARLTELYGR